VSYTHHQNPVVLCLFLAQTDCQRFFREVEKIARPKKLFVRCSSEQFSVYSLRSVAVVACKG
jgi:hypothetical protein